ncbi:MAG TPA: flavodoxin domain-containing protein [Candidatus Deferrimicrobiaceae bacterium]|nr:flavodoxin domain-containing protein [Candidatus Deferrimicrobiaceae bacterium]
MRALVLYGSRWGGTVAVAQRIGQTLSAEGLTVDVADAQKPLKNPEVYSLFVIGSGMRADKWTKETLAFMEKNSKLLQTKKTALFVSCQMADRTEPEIREKARKQYLQDTADKYGLKPICFGFFGGFLDFKNSHGLIVDIMVRVNRKSLRRNGLDTTKVHDTRDWNNIAAWARETAKKALTAY